MNTQSMLLREEHFLLERIKKEKDQEMETARAYEILNAPRLIRAHSNSSSSSDSSSDGSSSDSYPGLKNSVPKSDGYYNKVARPRMRRRHRRAKRNKTLTRSALVVFVFMLCRYNLVHGTEEDTHSSAMGMLGLVRATALFWCLITWQRYVKDVDHP